MNINFSISAEEIHQLLLAKAEKHGLDLEESGEVVAILPRWQTYCSSEEGQLEAFESGRGITGLLVTFSLFHEEEIQKLELASKGLNHDHH
jgi:DNA polymerase III delta subunit